MPPDLHSFARKDRAELFPTLVWAFDLHPADAERCNGVLLRQLEALTPLREHRDDLSLQSPHDLHQRPCFAPLKPKVDLAVREVMTFLELAEAEFQVTGAWLNLSSPGIRHHAHTHPNNWLSMVYYVRTPSGGDTIRFYDPRPQAMVMMPATRRLGPYTGSSMILAAQAGRLMVFPSWLQHSVDPNKGEGDRVSLAINVMFTQFGERMAAPLWKPKLV